MRSWDSHVCYGRATSLQRHSATKAHFTGSYLTNLPQVSVVGASCRPPRASSDLKCTVKSCPVLVSSSSKLLNHLESHVRKGQSVKCPCEKLFTNRSTLRSHFKRNHRDTPFVVRDLQLSDNISYASDDVELPNDEMSYNVEMSNDVPPLDSNLNVNSNSSDNISSALPSVTSDDFLKSFALMLLRLQSKSFLSITSLQFVIEAIQGISDHAVEYQKRLFNDLADKYGIPSNIRTAVENEVFNHNLYEEAVGDKGLFRSHHMRKKYYSNNFDFIPPVEYELVSGTKTYKYHYVDVKKSLASLLTDKSVQELYNKKGNNQPNILKDFEDGTAFKKNKFFIDNPDGLKIILYMDAFEPCEPLKAARGKHKMLAVYMTLGNMPAYCRSTRDPIQLVMLVHADTLKEFSYEQIFSPLLEDLKSLYEVGINVVFNGTPVNLKGCVVGVSSDNLEAHTVGGFNQSFSAADFYCRYCYARRAQRIRGDVSLCVRRNCFNYDNDARSADERDEPVKGVWEASVLNEIPGFHVMNGLPPCSAHDIAEGFLPKDLFIALKILVKAKWFNWNYVNAKVKFVNGKNANVTIREINPKKKKIVGSASSNLRLLQVITLALIDRVEDPSHEAWQMIVKLQEFMKLVCAHEISLDQTFRIDVLAEQYVNLRKSVIPQVTLKCKHHYILHYGELTRMYGPLQRWSTIRFESKHQYFKSASKHAPNFINPTMSFSYRHQYMQAYLREGNLFPTAVSADSVTQYRSELYSAEVNRALEECGPFHSETYVAVKSEYHGIKYSLGEIIMLEENNDGQIRCLSIDLMLVVENYKALVFIGAEKYVIYHSHLGIYEIVPSTNSSCISCHIRDTAGPDPLKSLSIGDRYFTYLKYAIRSLY
ncbi:hypothetical protein FOCC_FOCC016374 [Frankliniella occidentalis]|nr:hypothetical protein FOCC_FOCC016374 [Frankliniella occidentalis]